MTYLAFIARSTLLLVFAAALSGKLRNTSAWTDFVTATGTLLGVRRARGVLAGLTVLAEGLTVGCLVVNRTAYAGLLLALAVLSIFLLVVARGVVRGAQTTCNCFGSGGTTLGWTHVWRNVLLVIVALLGVCAGSIGRVPSIVLGSTYATPLVVSLIAAAVFAMWDDIAYLVRGVEPS